MGHYDSGGIMGQDQAHHFPGMYRRAINGTTKQLHVTDNVMPSIQQQEGKDFIGNAVQS